ncbi:MAG: hypothetical protein IT361_05520 [Gemmatimonadaceae bacterium]|nr:hypothetical protein [Gemmatimonadaceae bacterium]
MLQNDIESRGDNRLSRVLSTVPGLRADGDYIYVPRAVGSSINRTCDGIVVFLDGVSYGMVSDVDRIARSADLAAIEVFLGASSVPKALAVPMSGCGVVALWSKR